MNHYIIPFPTTRQRELERFLVQQEPWSIIASDALHLYGLNHPKHYWFAEYQQGRLIGVIYQHDQLVHFAYPQAPSLHSPLYPFIKTYLRRVITHGKKEVLEPIVQRLRNCHVEYYELCDFVRQTPQTEKLLSKLPSSTTKVQLRTADVADLPAINQLFKGSEIEGTVDIHLISKLIYIGRVKVAQKNETIIGTIMNLKESPYYCLLGGLFVKEDERHQQIASLLGQQMIQDSLKKGKQICFYYSDPVLKNFYSKAAFVKMGEWVSYTLLV